MLLTAKRTITTKEELLKDVAEPVEVAELRAEIARQRKQKYRLAAEIGVHPIRLGRMLNGLVAMPMSIYASTCSALGICVETRADA